MGETAKLLAEPVNKLLVPLANAAGTTLQDAWELVFGGFGVYVEKKRLQRMQNLTDFKASLEKKVAAISEGQLCEPKLSLVGPALEASKYYLEEPELREMFANLISSAMDSKKAPHVQPAFTEIIKQLSPLDAHNLMCFQTANQDHFPIAEYHTVEAENRYRIAASNVVLFNPLEQDIAVQAISITALSRLGLVQVAYDIFIRDESVYAPFYKTAEYQSLLNSLENTGGETADVRKGVLSLTPLGKLFISVCLPGDGV